MATALEEKPRSEVDLEKIHPSASSKLMQCEIGTTVEDKPKRTLESSAIETLQSLGYEWKGGELWKPPVGVAPGYLKPKRMREEYVKCGFNREWQAVRHYNEEGELFVIDCNGNYTNVNDMSGAWYEVVCRNYDSIYRIVEVEVSEREEFIEKAYEISKRSGTDDDRVFLGLIFDELVE